MKQIRVALVSLVIVVLMGCNLPKPETTPEPVVIYTLAAQTVAAELTRVATTQSPPVEASPTLAAIPPTAIPSTPTPIPTATPTPVPCNLAKFVIDVTIPDNTLMYPGQTFQKTWRLKNVGTCSWTSGYQLVFDHGDPLGVPAGYAQSLTSGTVAPGQTVDLSVNLTAPAAKGSYQGFWKLREPGGAYFSLASDKNFWVLIKVGSLTTVTLTSVSAEDGYAASDGSTNPNPDVGDNNANSSLQAFLSFDISGIAANAIITEVKVSLGDGHDVLGNPFGNLHCLYAYQQDFGSLDGGDYFSGSPSGPLENWCSVGALTSVEVMANFKIALQTKVGNPRFQFRLQFSDLASNGDGVADAVRLGSPKLIVTYLTP